MRESASHNEARLLRVKKDVRKAPPAGFAVLPPFFQFLHPGALEGHRIRLGHPTGGRGNELHLGEARVRVAADGDNLLKHKSGSIALYTTALRTRFVRAFSRLPRPDAGPGRGKFGRETESQLSRKGFSRLSPDCHPVTRCMW